MSKKLITPATPNLIVVPSLNRRQILGGLGAMALPILGCSSDEGDGGPVGSSGAGGSPAAGSGPGGAAGSGVAGSPVAGSPAGGTPGVAGAASTAGAPNGGGGMAGSGVTGGTSPGGAPGTSGAGAGGGGASGGPGAGAGGTAGAAGGATAGSGGSGGGGLVPPSWDAVNMCTASKTDGAGQGPFMIHDGEKNDDVSLVRQDIRGRYNMNAEPGVEMHLHLRILSSKSSGGSCDPVKDAEIYIWHTDGQGFYSGFGMPGDQKPDDPYTGVPGQNDLDNPDRFCRGVQVTNADGVVSFRSVFPGWYNGRDVHIHFIALKKGSMSRGRMTYSGAEHLFTTQFYFQPELTASVHEQYEPYKARTKLSAYAGAIKADEANNSGLRAKASLANDIVTAQMQILLDPKL